MSSDRFDLIVIGSGAAAASCWHAAVRMGKRVAVVESDVLGGECPTFACMPTKALLHCAEVFETVARGRRVRRVDGPGLARLLEGEGVEGCRGLAHRRGARREAVSGHGRRR